MNKQLRKSQQNIEINKSEQLDINIYELGSKKRSQTQRFHKKTIDQNLLHTNPDNPMDISLSNYIDNKSQKNNNEENKNNQKSSQQNMIPIANNEQKVVKDNNNNDSSSDSENEEKIEGVLKLNKAHIELLKKQSSKHEQQKDENTAADYDYKRFQSKSTMQSEELYFVQDVYRTLTTLQDEDTISIKKDIADIEKQEKKKKKKKKNYFITFRWAYFYEYFFYHFLFLAMVGPFTALFLYFKPGVKMLRNLNFWGSNGSFYFQSIQYFMALQILFCYYYIGYDHYYFYGEYVYVLTGIFFRIISISFKYATYDPLQNSAMHKRLWKMEEKAQELLLGEWFGQTTKTEYTEIHFQIRRQEIDESMFYMSFMVLPKEEQMEKIQEDILDLSGYHEGKVFQPDPIGSDLIQGNMEFIFGYGIIKYLTDIFQKENQPFRRRVYKITFVYVFIRNCIPFLLRFYEGRKLMGDSLYEGTAIVFTFLLSLFVVYYMLAIGWLGVIDLKRKRFLMDQMTFMLSPRKLQDIDGKKYLNSINIFTSLNLKGWMLIRKVMFDYGQKFFLRIQYNIGMLLFIAILFVPILILATLDMINTDPAFIVLSLSDIIYLIIILLYYMYLGAEINNSFKKHIEILMENKQIIDDFYRNRNVYFPQKQSDDTSIFIRKVNQQFQSQNFLYSKGVNFINENIKPEYIHSYIHELSYAYKQFILDLKHEEQVYPLKIFNITIRYTILESIIIGSLSSIGSIAGMIVYNLNNEEK